MIKIVTVRQGAKPAVESIDGGLAAMQKIVGGYIEVVRRPGLPRGVDLIANEEGMLDELPPNGCGILGPYFFCRWNADGDAVDLTDADIVVVLAYYASHRGESHPTEYEGDIMFWVKFGDMISDAAARAVTKLDESGE